MGIWLSCMCWKFLIISPGVGILWFKVHKSNYHHDINIILYSVHQVIKFWSQYKHLLLFVNLLFRMRLCKQGLNIVVMSHCIDTDYWLGTKVQSRKKQTLKISFYCNHSYLWTKKFYVINFLLQLQLQTISSLHKWRILYSMLLSPFILQNIFLDKPIVLSPGYTTFGNAHWCIWCPSNLWVLISLAL